VSRPTGLPAHLESLIYRLILDVLSDAPARPTAPARSRCALISGPQAWLHITHDGTSQFGADSFLDHPLTALSAEILVQPSDTGVVSVSLSIVNGQSTARPPSPKIRLIP